MRGPQQRREAPQVQQRHCRCRTRDQRRLYARPCYCHTSAPAATEHTKSALIPKRLPGGARKAHTTSNPRGTHLCREHCGTLLCRVCHRHGVGCGQQVLLVCDQGALDLAHRWRMVLQEILQHTPPRAHAHGPPNQVTATRESVQEQTTAIDDARAYATVKGQRAMQSDAPGSARPLPPSPPPITPRTSWRRQTPTRPWRSGRTRCASRTPRTRAKWPSTRHRCRPEPRIRMRRVHPRCRLQRITTRTRTPHDDRVEQRQRKITTYDHSQVSQKARTM